MKNISKKNQNEIDHFTKLPNIWWGLKTPAGQRRYDIKLKLFQRKCNLSKASSILEVGCGNGEFTKRLMTVIPAGTMLTATDITPKLISNNRELIKDKKVIFKVNNLESLDFPNNKFDIVCGISILHHVKPNKALSEIYRILKKNGEIFFTEPNMLNPQIFITQHIGFLRKIVEFSPDETAFYRWSLKKEFKKTQFKSIEIVNIDFLHPYIPSLLITPVEKLSLVAERIPFIRELSGSLLVYAKK